MELTPQVTRLLRSLDWSHIHPCGHPAQRFPETYGRPPCATCSVVPTWTLVVRQEATAAWNLERTPPACHPPVEYLRLVRTNIRTTVNGHADLAWLWEAQHP